MMIGETRRNNPMIHVPPWPSMDDPKDDMCSPYPISGVTAHCDDNANCRDYSPFYLQEALTALQRYLPSNETADLDSDSDMPVDFYSCDNFRMYDFKVRRCARGRSHDWTDCPYAHPGEKARRRDPRKYHYSGTACPEFRKGSCKKGDSCEFAHGVFECWLHPSRYRTQPCKDGLGCRRKVCFFAHSPEQLRVFSSQNPLSYNSGGSYNESTLPQVQEVKSAMPFVSSPVISPPGTPTTESPPLSPITRSLSRSLGSNSINEMVASIRNLQLGKVKSLPSSYQLGSPGTYGSPRGSNFRPGYFSLPTTPTVASSRQGMRYLDFWEEGCEEEAPMERVESGRDLRAKMFEKLSKENPLEPTVNLSETDQSGGPDVGWISELVN